MKEAVTRDAILAQSRGEVASQATVVEQSRAIAEVQGALVMAQKCPRDEAAALAKALESCRTKEVAETAFFKFPRGGQTVSGETIHLAVELARCWGNIDYAIMELSRDDFGGKSEMLALARDLETNAQCRMTFIVPHKRDKRGGAETLTDMRDIYENNANMGARRLRECIYRVLPPYLKEAAKAACYKTLEGGAGEKPLPVRLAEAIEAFGKIGISKDRIEQKVGVTVARMSATDLANLTVSYRSVIRNEVSADEEFPRVGVEEATNAARALVDKSPPKGRDTATEGNPTADEGKGPEDHGEGHNGDEEDPEQRARDRETTNTISKAYGGAGNIIDLANLKAARAADIEALPDDMRADLDDAYSAAETKLRKGNG